MKAAILIASTLALAACDSSSVPDVQAAAAQVATGKQVFEQNCIQCHGVNARGLVKDWQKTGPDGKYPAPPLNGTAHAWHHDMKTLLGTIDRGGIPLGGTMPSFKDKLSQEQKEAVIAYIQSLWPDKIYQSWKQRNG